MEQPQRDFENVMCIFFFFHFNMNFRESGAIQGMLGHS